MNSILDRWNNDAPAAATETMMACCAARRWAAAMVQDRPVRDEETLHQLADRNWDTMSSADWLEAFAAHPRIGDRQKTHPSGQAASWSREEQSGTSATDAALLARLAEENQRYEKKFGFTFIVCATGRSASEMLEILQRRLANHRDEELRQAAGQQRQILHIRLRKWLSP